MTRERRQLDQLIKSWAQEQCTSYVIADHSHTTEGMDNTSGHLSWVIQEGHAVLDLSTLADKFELFLINRNKRKSFDGMFCKRCQNFYEFAESNQKDGSLICYGCRNNPYR